MDIERVLKEAKQDRFALIIPPEWEEFVNQHIAEIFPVAKVTGILVDEYAKGVAYHCTNPVNVKSIMENGFKVKPVEDDSLTFGGGVVYCWPESHDIKGAALAETAVLKVEYDGHVLRSIALEDADPRDEYQILIFPDAIKSVQYIGNVGKVEDLDKLLTKHFGSGLILSEIIQYDSYKELVELLYEVGDLAESVDLIENVVKMLDRITGRKSSKFTEWEPLEDILIKHFGEGFPFPEAPCCDSYGKLVDVLYDVSNLLNINLEDILETLDDICCLDAVRDENGELVYDQQRVAEILEEQNRSEDYE